MVSIMHPNHLAKLKIVQMNRIEANSSQYHKTYQMNLYAVEQLIDCQCLGLPQLKATQRDHLQQKGHSAEVRASCTV